MTEPFSSSRRRIGRSSTVDTGNRFESTRCEEDHEHLTDEDDAVEPRKVTTEFLSDASRSVICENNSPDIPFRYSINPYRGCEHGCAYCYARPGHEYLGMNAGLDFESKILVKYDAAERLREELNRPSWNADWLAISGVTDCYQPAERRLRITRSILEVLHEARQPLGIITKNALVTRDVDLLAPLAEINAANVAVSLTTLDAELARKMEPRTATPEARLRAIAELSSAAVPVRVMVAPIIPGLNDHEVPELLAAAHRAGAVSAGYVMLRLPLAVEPIFLAWLNEFAPERREVVESRIRAVRDGQLSDSQFGRRLRGSGPYAEGIDKTFRVFAKKLSLDRPLPDLDGSHFNPPKLSGGQLRLF